MSRSRRTPAADRIAAAVGVAVALAVAVVAVIAIPPHAPPPAPVTAAKLPADLTHELAALRGRLTAVDKAFLAKAVIDGEPSFPGLPAHRRWPVVPGSARLVADLPARGAPGRVAFYLLAVRVPPGLRPLSATGGGRLHGERPAVAVVTGAAGRPIAGAVHGIVFSSGVPDLAPAAAAGYEYAVAGNQPGHEEWIFNRVSGPGAWTRPIVVRAAVRHNIAVAAIPSGHPELTTAVSFDVTHLGRLYGYSYESVTLHRPARYPQVCRSSQLRATAQYLPRAGEPAFALALTDRAPAGCELRGYPTIALLDRRGAAIPFSYRHRGDATVTGRAPASVAVDPLGQAGVAIGKAPCARRSTRVAATLRLTAPGDRGDHSLRLSGSGLPDLDYCGRRNRGDTIDVSPVEATVGAALTPAAAARAALVR